MANIVHAAPKDEKIYKEEFIFEEDKEVDDKIYLYIKKTLTNRMLELDLSYYDIAKMIRGSESYVYKVFYGKSKPGLIVLLKICIVLDLSLSDILPPIYEENGQECNMKNSWYLTTADSMYYDLLRFMKEHNIQPLEQRKVGTE